MIHLDPNSLKVRNAQATFKRKMKPLIENRIEGVSNAVGRTFLDDHVIPIIEDVLVGTPERLIEIHDDLTPDITGSAAIKEAVDQVFKYSWFISKTVSRYDAYDLAKSLDVTTCVYCNRNYTITVTTKGGKKITRPQFDHFFDKASHPILALSFYNLVPSCPGCNAGVKHRQAFELGTHIHPFVDNKVGEVEFNYKYDVDSKTGLKITVAAPNCTRTQETLTDLAIEEIYNGHTDILRDLLKTRQAFSDRYLEMLSKNVLEGVFTSKNELYRIAFGTELNEKDFVNRPFSKFKKDILVELGVVKK